MGDEGVDFAVGERNIGSSVDILDVALIAQQDCGLLVRLVESNPRPCHSSFVNREEWQVARSKRVDAFSTAISNHPDSHLELLQDEILRQRSLTNEKLANTYTKATVLVGATGVLGSVTVTATGPSTLVLIVDLILYAAAAVLGIISIRTKRGSEVSVEAMVIGAAEKTDAALQRSLIASNFASYLDYERSLAERSRAVTAGFILLVSAFLVFSGDKVAEVISPQAPLPTHIIIDKGKP